MNFVSPETILEEPDFLVRQFVAQVASNGSRLALSHDGSRVTFGELNDRSDRIASGLNADCPYPPIVAVHAAASIDAVATLLAILKLGGTYVPLEPEHPKARNQAIIDTANPDIIVSEENWQAEAPRRGIKELISAKRSLPANVNHEPILKIVFTSGSTGQPKGVRIPKNSLANRLAWMQEAYPFQNSDVLLLQKSLALVAAAVEVFQGLLTGIPTVISSRSTTRDPVSLMALLERESITHVLGSPALWLGLVDQAESTGKKLAALRFATTSAEPMSADLGRRCMRCFPSIPFLNLYGSTECSSNAVAFDLQELRDSDRSVPIGRPIRNVRLSVREEQKDDKPEEPGILETGKVGELCISGACLADGYLDEDLTRQSFLSDPETAQRMLRTGDLAYERDDGNIVLVGRSDNRVSVYGYRVELEDVERALGSHGKVRECAVALMSGGLVGYVVGSDWDVAELRSHLQAQLPGYMLPQYWVSLSELPRNEAGKLDRTALPLPGTDRPEIGIQFRPASTPLEELVSQVFSDVLNFTKVGMDDDFHAFGGSSVQAARILARIGNALRTNLPFAAFMADATPAGLVGSINARLGDNLAIDIATTWTNMQTSQDDLAAKRYQEVLRNANLDTAVHLPAPTDSLSFGQSSLWFFQQLHPQATPYNLTFAYRLFGPLHHDALRAAINDVVASNESLRSAFVEVDGRPAVRATSSDACVVDVTNEEIPEQGINVFVDECARQTLRLDHAPLLRAMLGSINRHDNILVLVVHHIVFDGWSRRILLNQIAEFYAQHLQESPRSVRESAPYGSFSALQRQWMDSDEASTSREFWREKLAGVDTPMPLPTRYPRPETHPHTGCTTVQRLDSDLTDRIDSFAREVRSTPFVTMLVGLKLLLMSKSIEDLIVGVPFANRDRPEFEETIGYFVNVVAVRTRYDASMSVVDLIDTESAAVNDAVNHGRYPFDRLVSDLSLPRSLACNPVFQVMFNLLGDQWDELSLNGIKSEPLTADNGGSQVDLGVAARRSGGVYSLTWEYCDALFDNESILTWQAEYTFVLSQLTANNSIDVSQLLKGVREFMDKRDKAASDALRSSRLSRLRNVRAPATAATDTGNSAQPSRKIARGQRREVNLSAATREEPLFADLSMVKIEPAVRGLDAVTWASENAATIQDRLTQCGGVLFRGFDIGGSGGFEAFFHAACGPLNEYTHRVTKRSQPGDSFVYTSTDHPKTLDLGLHNETSYTKEWPAQLGFYCAQPSPVGGQTPIADSRKILADLPGELLARFSSSQLLYTRNSGNSIEMTWQETFQTDDKATVEEYCRSHEMECEWKPDGQLRTRQRCHVMARHPVTGEPIWFNQAHLMHRSAYPPGVIDGMFAATPDDDLPFNASFGDNSPIPDADISLINELYKKHAHCFDWQKGDVMILDNMLMAHGRKPFDGDRRILVAMSGTISANEQALIPGETA